MKKLKFPNGTECYSGVEKQPALTVDHWRSLALLAAVMLLLKMLPWIFEGTMS